VAVNNGPPVAQTLHDRPPNNFRRILGFAVKLKIVSRSYGRLVQVDQCDGFKMPYQNRVTPFGTIITTPARGTLLGNRGCLHDDEQRLRRPYQTTRWIICVLAFKNVRRQIMKPGSWTELFFLDEATALAAGHRPCAYCQRTRFELFRVHWAAANPTLAGSAKPLVPTIDAVLQRERIAKPANKITFAARLADLPAGTILTDEVGLTAWLWWHRSLHQWTPAGYTTVESWEPTTMVHVLTPRSVVNALAHGYPVTVHASVA